MENVRVGRARLTLRPRGKLSVSPFYLRNFDPRDIAELPHS